MSKQEDGESTSGIFSSRRIRKALQWVAGADVACAFLLAATSASDFSLFPTNWGSPLDFRHSASDLVLFMAIRLLYLALAALPGYSFLGRVTASVPTPVPTAVDRPSSPKSSSSSSGSEPPTPPPELLPDPKNRPPAAGKPRGRTDHHQLLRFLTSDVKTIPSPKDAVTTLDKAAAKFYEPFVQERQRAVNRKGATRLRQIIVVCAFLIVGGTNLYTAVKSLKFQPASSLLSTAANSTHANSTTVSSCQRNSTIPPCANVTTTHYTSPSSSQSTFFSWIHQDVLEATFFCGLIFLTSIECALLSKYLSGAIDLIDVPACTLLHGHGLEFIMDVACTGCDECRQLIKREGFRCAKCNYDVCLECYCKKRKVAAEMAKVEEQEVKEGGDLEAEKKQQKPKKVREPISTKEHLIRTSKLCVPFKHLIGATLISLTLVKIASVLSPNYQGQVINSIIQQNWVSFETNLKIYIGLAVLSLVLGSVKSFANSLINRKLSNHVQVTMFRALLSRKIPYFDNASTGSITSRMGQDAHAAILSPFNTLLNNVLGNTLLLVGGFLMCMQISWRLSLVAFTIVGPTIQVTAAYSAWSSILWRKYWDSRAEANNVATQSFTNIRTVKAFSTETLEQGKYVVNMRNALSAGVRQSIGEGGSHMIRHLMDVIVMGLILGLGGTMVMEGQQQQQQGGGANASTTSSSSSSSLTIGSLITFQLYINLMNGAYQGLNDVLNVFTEAAGAADRVFEMLEEQTEDATTTDDKEEDMKKNQHATVSIPSDTISVNSAATQLPKKGKTTTIIRPPVFEGEIEAHAVDFAYASRPTSKVLSNFSATFKKNQVTAMVGKSGGGKSTVMHMLLRFYDPTKGTFTLDGRPLTQIDLKWLHEHTAVVAQETQLFANTIEENIAYGIPPAADGVSDGYTQDELIQAATKANAIEFIQKFDDGFQTTVGERGVKLSGGQKQRIAIARAFLRKPKLLILDEATSALDSESESLVQSALDNLMMNGGTEGEDGQEGGGEVGRRCTTIVVAHRLSTVVKADTILVLADGAVVEQGTHQNLLQQQGTYAKLIAHQLAGFAPTEEEKKNTDESDAAVAGH